MRIFLDANILFSASDIRSATRVMFNAACANAVVVTNLHAWEEAARNLEAKRPACLDGLAGLLNRVVLTSSLDDSEMPELPPDDIPILAGAIGARCTHLWTGDKRHFGQYYGKTIAGVRVVSTLDLAEDFLTKGFL